MKRTKRRPNGRKSHLRFPNLVTSLVAGGFLVALACDDMDGAVDPLPPPETDINADTGPPPESDPDGSADEPDDSGVDADAEILVDAAARDGDAAPITLGGFSETAEVASDAGSFSAGHLSKTNDGKILLTATGDQANITEVDPAGGAVKQTAIPNVIVNGAQRRADGSTVFVGRSGITPLAAAFDATNQTLWAMTFGAGLERAVGITPLDVNDYLVSFAGKVLRLPASGTGATTISFDTPSKTNVRTAVPLMGGGWIAGAEVERTFPEQDLLVFAMAANNTLAWQRLIANGGRNFFSSILGLSDGGALLLGGGQPPGPTVASQGWIARLAGDGALLWQRVYGSAGTIGFSSAIQTPTGFRVAASSGGLSVMDLNSDGSVVATWRFKDSQSSTVFGSMGIAQTAGNEVLIGGFNGFTHTYQIVKTNLDLNLGCADTALRTPLTISSAAASLVFTTPTHVATSTATTGTPVVVTAGATTATTPVDQCTNN